jgi:predicted HicB family RNase H-like nuclease
MAIRGGKKNMSRKSYQRTTKQVRVDSEWHKILKIEAAKRGDTLEGLLDEILSEWWKVNKD